MTALAAAIAITSTPLLAQDSAPAPADATIPVIATPLVESAPAAAVPAPALNIPKISVNMSDAPVAPGVEATATPAMTNSARPEPSPVVEKSAAAPVRAAPATTAPAAPEPAPMMAKAVEAPAPESPLPTPSVAVAPPVPTTATAAAAPVASSDETLPVAGGVLAALALAGGAFAFAGRKRRYREEYRDAALSQQPTTAALLTGITPMSPQPSARYTPPPVMAETISPALPAGFDMSRYGPHVQAAYRGPTPDNPSLSLSKRLKRARFYDQRERMTTTERADSWQAARAPAAQPQPVRKPEFVTSRGINMGNGGFRPAYQG